MAEPLPEPQIVFVVIDILGRPWRVEYHFTAPTPAELASRRCLAVEASDGRGAFVFSLAGD